MSIDPVVTRLPPPLACAYCPTWPGGPQPVLAQYEVDGTSVCYRHVGPAVRAAREKRQRAQ